MSEIIQNKQENALSTSDWVMAVISFFLTPIVTIALSIYNFSRSRKPQGKLYLGVLGAQIVIGLILISK